jgi:hypothetical protein
VEGDLILYCPEDIGTLHREGLEVFPDVYILALGVRRTLDLLLLAKAGL